MPTVFYESDLEQAALEWFEELDYSIAFGPEIGPGGTYEERTDFADVILKERLKEALGKHNPNLSPEELDQAYRQIYIPQNPSLIMNNKAFQKMTTDGITVSYRGSDGIIKYIQARVFDFDNPDNNDWLVVNQFTVVENSVDKRPDIVIFVNGIPLVVIELKSASIENVDISDGYHQLQTYISRIPSLFTYNAFSITSDGINAKVGTLTSNEERFMAWRTIDGDEVAPANIPQLEVLIKGMFEKKRFLDIIKQFILFQTDGSETYKILAGYHQYHAVNKALENTERATEEGGDRRVGVIWHTQGSGKSLTMVFYAGKLVLSEALENPTIVVITDRNDLDDQLFATFAHSKDLLRGEPQQADNRGDLRKLLNNRTSGGIIFTTIQKFAPEEKGDIMPVLTDRKNVVVIADEAHRSQYGFGADIIKDVDEATIKYGYAKYMRDALPNASYIGFTGTPIESTDKNTKSVFGEYIDIYDMTRAVQDGTTVKIYYESRVAKLDLPEQLKPKIDVEYDEITEFQEYSQRQQLMSKWSRLEAIVGAEQRLKVIAKDIVEHFEKRQTSQENTGGKGMIVTMSRRIAINLYKEIVAIKPDWHSDEINEGKIKVVITGASSDPAEWQKFIGTKADRKMLDKRIKDKDDKLQLVIVRDMWLTGFDVPSMHTMYVDKPMQGHNLMQAIARVNRVFKEKQGGLIVDYIGIADKLKEALAEYTDSDKKTTGVDTTMAADLLLEKMDIIRELLHAHDYNKFFTGSAKEKMQAIVETMDFILGLRTESKEDYIKLVTELSRAYSLCSTTDIAIELNVEIGFHQAVKTGIVKLIADGSQKKTISQLDAELNQLISKSISSDEVIDILAEAGLQKPDISILSDEFLEEIKGMKQKNLAVELLSRLLKGSIRAFARHNLIQSKKFSDLLEQALRKYQNRTIETTQIIMELIELAKSITEAKKRGEDSGLSEDEMAFYDALIFDEAAKGELSDDILKQIAIDLAVSLKKNMSVDWNIRSSVQSRMRMIIKRLLKKYGYPQDKSEQATETVLEQARLMCENEI